MITLKIFLHIVLKGAILLKQTGLGIEKWVIELWSALESDKL